MSAFDFNPPFKYYSSGYGYKVNAMAQEAFIKEKIEDLGLTVEQLKAGYVLEVDQNQNPVRLAVNTKGVTIIDEVRP